MSLRDENGNVVNTFDVMRRAMNDARIAFRAADEIASQCARLLVGRLRHCSTDTLREMKRELRDFNMTTGRWNDD